jgi:hypothetical protein
VVEIERLRVKKLTFNLNHSIGIAWDLDLTFSICFVLIIKKKKKNHKTFITQNTKVRFKQKLDIEENLVVFSNEREIDSQYGIHFRKINFTTR